ncbi:Hypothetical predicted protein [Mytilus galloprovincialis]|uniref:Uncharacterized protein n=1 Tax=Mytilus galloprovincialis TaxID=29158 RepID=A0A8B6HID1_MYTGA|nr:Hypothetical predicted protein [Mytilus galloprovincialis]
MDSQQNNSAIRQPINLEAISNTDEAFTQAQVAQASVRYIRSLSANLRQQINIRKGIQNIYSCIKIDNIFVFTDYYNNQLIIYDADVTDAHYISLPIKPFYITKVDSNTVAVSCTSKTILIINICTGSVTQVQSKPAVAAMEYDENNLYVVNDNKIDVIDLTGKFKNTIPIPSLNIRDISVYKDTLICIDNKSIYYCSLDGTLKWQFNNDKFKDLRGVKQL